MGASTKKVRRECQKECEKKGGEGNSILRSQIIIKSLSLPTTSGWLYFARSSDQPQFVGNPIVLNSNNGLPFFMQTKLQKTRTSAEANATHSGKKINETIYSHAWKSFCLSLKPFFGESEFERRRHQRVNFRCRHQVKRGWVLRSEENLIIKI